MFQKKGTPSQQQPNFTFIYDKYGGINSCSSNTKKIIFQTKNSKMCPSSEDKEISPSLETTDGKDQELLALVEGYQIPLLMEPLQEKAPKVLKLNQEQQKQVDLEVNAMLEKGSISKVCHSKGEFLSSFYLISKKGGGNRPVINLKDLNWFTPYRQFKMEGLHCLKYVFQKGDYMCKIDLKDAHFSVPLHKDSQKLVRFPWAGNLYEFLGLCFGLGPALRIFTKLLKVAISVLRRLMIRVIIYLDDLLILGNSMSEIFIARDSVIFRLQHLGFVINLKKCVLDTAQTMTLSFPAEKIGSMPEVIQDIRGITSGFDKTNRNTFLNHSSSAPTMSTVSLFTTTANCISKTITVLPHFRKADSHGKKRVVMVGQQSGTLQWPIGYTTTGAGPYSDRCIQKRLGEGGCMSRDQKRGSVAQEGTGSTYQSAGTFSHKVCHFDICQNVENVSHTYPGRHHDSLELFAENGRDKESRTNADLKGNLGISNWAGDHDYCQTFTRESQLQGRLGVSTPEKFLRMETVPSNFQQNMANIGKETRNRPVYFKVIKSTSKLLLLEARSQQSWHRCSSTGMISQKTTCIPSICLDSQSTEKSRGGEKAFSNSSNSNLAEPKLVPRALTSFMRNSTILPLKEDLLKGPKNQQNPLIQNRTIQLAVWVVSGNVWQRKKYQKGLQTLLSHQEEQVLSQIIHRPGISGLAGVSNKTLIQFDVM